MNYQSDGWSSDVFNNKIKNYKEFLKIKPKSLQLKYPYTNVDKGDTGKTIKQIEIVYQTLKVDDFKLGKVDDFKLDKKQISGGRSYPITVFDCQL
jgi:hypothetical protein